MCENVDIQIFVGKTISSIDSTTENIWVLYFQDGTSVEIEAVNFGDGLPVLEAHSHEEVEPEEFNPAQPPGICEIIDSKKTKVV